MAASGKEKWKKYFSQDKVKTLVEAKSGQSTVSVWDLQGKSQIDSIPTRTEVIVLVTKAYDPKYTIEYKKGGKTKIGKVSESLVKKPGGKKGATENLKIQSTTLITGGKLETRMIGDKDFRARVFYDIATLEKSIISGLKKNPNVSEDIVSVVSKYFKSKYTKIVWTPGVSDSERNELGKYLGEMIIGVLCLAKKTKTEFIPNPFTKAVKAFIMPDDPSFAGIDSIVELVGGELIPISSKFGVGAKASIFANLLPKGMLGVKHLSASPFKDLCQIAIKNNIDPNKAGKEIVYIYGVRNILKLPEGSGKKAVKDAFQVYKDIQKENMSPDVLTALAAITSYKPDKKILDSLPDSITAFFCREIAERLNNDKKAIEDMKEILSGKNYWQANLNIPEWNKGKVVYKMSNSGKVELKIIGSKSAINDLAAKQGLVNFELRMS